MADVVQDYIDLKKHIKESEEKMRAIETIIFADDSLSNDNRIRIQEGKKTYIINEDTYENLKAIGVEVEITETRFKKLNEFDVSIQKAILDNPENFTVKQDKSSIRVK